MVVLGEAEYKTIIVLSRLRLSVFWGEEQTIALFKFNID